MRIWVKSGSKSQRSRASVTNRVAEALTWMDMSGLAGKSEKPGTSSWQSKAIKDKLMGRGLREAALPPCHYVDHDQELWKAWYHCWSARPEVEKMTQKQSRRMQRLAGTRQTSLILSITIMTTQPSMSNNRCFPSVFQISHSFSFDRLTLNT